MKEYINLKTSLKISLDKTIFQIYLQNKTLNRISIL